MSIDLKNNPFTSFIRTSQSVSKERKSILHTVRGKCYFQVSLKALHQDHYYSIYIYAKKYWKVKLLGINLESRLNFDYHVNTLLNKANKKYHALARVRNYMNTNKRWVLMKTFLKSQFFYCPLVWMFHSRTMNNRINKLHEKA